MTNNNIEEPENNNKQHIPDIESIARQVAWNKASVARWGVNHIIFLFTLLIIIILMVAMDITMIIVMLVAVTGLGYVWFSGWKRGKQLYTSFLNEETINLQKKPEKIVDSSVTQLTTRELQVLKCIGQGYANKQIALELGISENTVKHFSGRVMTKLNASSRTEAVVIAIKSGLINLE
jgi:DNA-binding CsgD family transcriptional regulator